MLIFIFCVLFYDTLIGSSSSFKEGLLKSQFNKEMILFILQLILIIIVNRICFKKKYTFV